MFDFLSLSAIIDDRVGIVFVIGFVFTVFVNVIVFVMIFVALLVSMVDVRSYMFDCFRYLAFNIGY